MSPAAANAVLDSLRQSPLLDAAQKEEAARLEKALRKPRDVVQELVRRGWLTFFQGTQILRGKGKELVLGQYQLLDKIGEGGMGKIYKARQRNLDRIVALKVIRPECLAKPKVLSRFQREIRASGHLSHPNIVRAFDADQVNGTYFIAMEYIDGVDLARMVRENGPLPVTQACDFIRQAALGLQHAHERGMVHRDIKPANLLVGRSQETAASGQEQGARAVKILDLGLARWDDRTTGRASTHLTQMGSVMGTPDFIAPEQARNSHTCDIRADLYSLGCTLYFLIAGRTPFVGASITEKLIQHQVDEAEPIGPVRQAMLVNFHARKGTARIPRKHVEVPEFVSAVIKKLMAKKPEDRYQTPGELAQALQETLDRLTSQVDIAQAIATETDAITAAGAAAPADDGPLIELPSQLRLPTRARIRQPWTRRRWLTIAGVSAAVLMALALAGLGGNNAKPRSSEPFAKTESPPPPPQDLAWQALQDEVRKGTVAPAELRTRLLEFKRLHRDRACDAAALLRKVPSPFDAFERDKIDGRKWPSYAWWPEELVGIVGLAGGLPWARGARSVAVSPDGACFACGGDDGAVHLWQTDGTSIPWKIAAGGRVTRVVFSPDGKLLAAVSDDGLARIYDVKSRNLLHTLNKHKHTIGALAFHPAGSMLATGGGDGVVRFWNTVTGDDTLEIQTPTRKVLSLAFSPDGKFIFWGGDNQEVRWANISGHNPISWVFTGNSASVTALAFHPDGRTLMCGDAEGTLRLCSFDGQNVKEKAVLRQHARVVNDIAVSDDGRTFVSVSDDKLATLWDATTGQMKKTWELRYAIQGAAFAPDCRHVLLANGNGSIFILRLHEAPAAAQAR
jgi:serine/threonine-protein kinase